MKYLAFNLLVAGALAYMLIGGDPPRTIERALDMVVGKTGPAARAQKQASRADPAKTRPAAAPETPSRPAASPPAPAKTAAPEPIIASMTAAVARRRAEVLGDAPARAATQATPAPRPSPRTESFMSPAERRRELETLAEDMEMVFFDKVAP